MADAHKESLFKRLEAPATVIASALFIAGVVARSFHPSRHVGDALLAAGALLFVLLILWWRFVVLRNVVARVEAAEAMVREMKRRQEPHHKERTLYEELVKSKERLSQIQDEISWARRGKSLSLFDWQ